MGIPVARDLQAELNAKVKALFDKVAEAINKDHPSHQDFDFESFVEGFDEDSPLTQEVFEYLVKDSALRYWDANPLTRPNPPYPHRHTIHHTPPASPSWARLRATISGSAVVPENNGDATGANNQSVRMRQGLYGIDPRSSDRTSGDRPLNSLPLTRSIGPQHWLTATTRSGRNPWNDTVSDENEDGDSEVEEPMRPSSIHASLSFNERLNSSIFNESDDDLDQDATMTGGSTSGASYRDSLPLPPRTSTFGVDSQTRQRSTLTSLSPPIDGWFDGGSRASRTSSYSFSQIETFRRATESLQRDIRSLRSQVAATQASFAAQRSSSRHNPDERRMALEQHLQRLQLLERHHTRSAVNLMEAQVQNVRRQQEQQRQQQQQVQNELRERITQHQARAQSTVSAPPTSSLPLSLSETVSIFTSQPRSTISPPPLPTAPSMLPYRPRATSNTLPSPSSARSSSPGSSFALGGLFQAQSSRTPTATIVSNSHPPDGSVSRTQRSRPPLTPSFSSSSSFSTLSLSSSSPFTSGSNSRSLLTRTGSSSSRDSELSSGTESATNSRHDLQASPAIPSTRDILTAAITDIEAGAASDDSSFMTSSTVMGTESTRPDPESYRRPSAEDYELFTALSLRRRQRLREVVEAAEGLRTSVERRRIVLEDLDHGDGEPVVELLLSDDGQSDPVGVAQVSIPSSVPLTPGPLSSTLEVASSSSERAEAEAIAMLTPVSTSRSTESPEPTDQAAPL
ncbi:hypothetical protein EMPS_09704 [Entomortierella parvispora]|uniref:Uncharacterized protein n=1 Tax=Entomortierella parvispora TaxID=205924 RepID=A0A9P3HIS3_9FUNG|nr:hypothetical protein EMPS_09704 [Entomortierella parvispora]